MSIFGLSGDAAIPLVLGNFLNLYAAIGAILTLDLTVKEVFIIAVMLSFSHDYVDGVQCCDQNGCQAVDCACCSHWFGGYLRPL